MTTPSPTDITQLLVDWGNGDKATFDRLVPLIHKELQRLASHYMRRERPGHTLQTSALVNEAYLRLIDQKNVRWQNRAHFFGIAAQLMRRILIDHARNHARAKRGGRAQNLSLNEGALATQEKASELLALDDALTDFFGGLSNEEAAEVLKVSSRTIEREWRKAKAWLHHAISKA